AQEAYRPDPPASDQELPGHTTLEPGRTDASCRGRMSPHAARKQQRLLPGQSDFLVRLAARRAAPGSRAVRAIADRNAAEQSDLASAQFPKRYSGPPRR